VADVIIRHDLAEADAETLEVAFLGFNAIRRQLHAVDQARIEVRLAEIRYGRPLSKFLASEARAIREQIAKRLNMTLRNAGRYLRLMRTPLEVQRAVRDGRLNLEQSHLRTW
jgi:hypothetical protein